MKYNEKLCFLQSIYLQCCSYVGNVFPYDGKVQPCVDLRPHKPLIVVCTMLFALWILDQSCPSLSYLFICKMHFFSHVYSTVHSNFIRLTWPKLPSFLLTKWSCIIYITFMNMAEFVIKCKILLLRSYCSNIIRALAFVNLYNAFLYHVDDTLESRINVPLRLLFFDFFPGATVLLRT